MLNASNESMKTARGLRGFRGIAMLVAAAAVWSGPARAEDPAPVNIGYYPGGMFNALFHVADLKNFYRDAGLKPTFISVANGPLMNSNIASGAIDFGNQPPSNVGLALDQGLDQVIIAGNITMPWILIARTDVALPSKGKYPGVIADLKGLNWGVYGRGSDNELFMRAMARDAKLDVDKDMTWIPVGGPPTGLPALKAKRIDVYLTIDPAPIVASTGAFGQTLVDLRKGEGPANFKGVMYQGVVALRKTAIERPKLVEAMVAAHVKAYCWINDKKNLPELMTIMRSNLPVGDLSEDQFRRMVLENLPSFTLRYPTQDLDVWNEMLLRSKVIKTPLTSAILWKTIPASDPKC
jgi:ABC-type nitrate/sulfonate/bicarbonate transport system substrate-binding protein